MMNVSVGREAEATASLVSYEALAQLSGFSEENDPKN